jgi:hypothetical protein
MAKRYSNISPTHLANKMKLLHKGDGKNYRW